MSIIEHFMNKIIEKVKVIPQVLLLFLILTLVFPISISNFIHFLNHIFSQLLPDIWDKIFSHSWFNYHEFSNAWFVLLIMFLISNIWEAVCDLSTNIIIKKTDRVGDFFFYINSLVFLTVLIYSRINPGTEYSVLSVFDSFDLFADNIIQQIILFVAGYWFFFLFSITYLTPLWEFGFFIYQKDNISSLKKFLLLLLYISALSVILYKIIL